MSTWNPRTASLAIACSIVSQVRGELYAARHRRRGAALHIMSVYGFLPGNGKSFRTFPATRAVVDLVDYLGQDMGIPLDLRIQFYQDHVEPGPHNPERQA